MDKYDVKFLVQHVTKKIKEIHKNRKNLKNDIQVKYLKWKYDKMLMMYYKLTIIKYPKKSYPMGIHEALKLDLSTRYVWDMLKLMPQPKEK